MTDNASDYGDVFQAVYIPKQRPAPEAVAPEMAAYIAVYPPLEQVTQLQDPRVTFTAVLEVPESLVKEPWQLSLWHSGTDGTEGGEWTEAVFEPSNSGQHPTIVNDSEKAVSRLYFTIELTIESSLSFTVKFRQSPNHSWRWIREEQRLGDGLVIIGQAQVQDGETDNLADLIHGLNPDVTWKPHMSQCPNTRLWSITARIKGATDENSTFVDIPLGIPWGKFIR